MSESRIYSIRCGLALLIGLAAQQMAIAQPGFSDEIQLNPEVPGANSQIAIAADANTAISVWTTYATLNSGTDDDIAISRSIDGGATWSAAALFNSYGMTDAAEDGYPFIGTDGNGVWLVAWKAENAPGAGQDPDFFFHARLTTAQPGATPLCSIPTR